MDQGLSIETMALLAGFAVLVASAAWHRTRLDAEIAALPHALRDRLGWELPGDASLRRPRHRIPDPRAVPYAGARPSSTGSRRVSRFCIPSRGL